MKKILLGIAVAGLVAVAYADYQSYNWQNGNGGSWGTPTSCGTNGQALTTDGNCNVKTTSNVGIGLTLVSSTTLAGLTPPTTGYLLVCQGCTTANAVLCISTGTAAGSWGIASSTSTVCK